MLKNCAKGLGQSRSVPMKGFEAEDAESIPECFRASRPDLKCPHRKSLHEILQLCHKNGRDLLPVKDMSNMTIADRHSTYTSGWRGPPVSDMIECGLIQVTDDSARCYWCLVNFRLLTPDVCIWTRHRHFSPSCRHLRKAKAHGHKARDLQPQRQRRVSFSDSMGQM